MQGSVGRRNWKILDSPTAISPSAAIAISLGAAGPENDPRKYPQIATKAAASPANVNSLAKPRRETLFGSAPDGGIEFGGTDAAESGLEDGMAANFVFARHVFETPRASSATREFASNWYSSSTAKSGATFIEEREEF